jgi:hypothetical protein
MGPGKLHQDQCMVSLLADHMQNVGTAKPNAKTLCTGSGLKSGVWVTVDDGRSHARVDDGNSKNPSNLKVMRAASFRSKTVETITKMFSGKDNL